MLKEEKALREAISIHAVPHSAKPITRLIPALIRAVREKCAKVADEEAQRFAEFADHARKKGHDVDDIVARRVASEDIAAAIRRGK